MPDITNMNDAQVLGFFVQQLAYIEREAYEQQYPEILFPELVPVDTSLPSWVDAVTFFSSDRIGEADWFNHASRSVPNADVDRQRFDSRVEDAAIGYIVTRKEIEKAQATGINIETQRANSAVRASLEMTDRVLLGGDANKGLAGMFNLPGITIANLQADGTGGATFWANKSPQQKLRDLNYWITIVNTSTGTVEWADTVLLPVAMYMDAANTYLGSEFPGTTVLQAFLRNNAYTSQTGRPVMVRGVRGLESAGVGGVGRVMVYRKDPGVLKAYINPHQFDAPWQVGARIWQRPGFFRIGGVDPRRPGAIRYFDGINAAGQ